MEFQFKLLYLIVAANRTAAQGFAATTFVEASRTLTMEVSIGAGCWDCKRMKKIFSSEAMDIPDGVSIKVEGPRGDFQFITDENGKKKLKIKAWFGTHKMRLVYNVLFFK